MSINVIGFFHFILISFYHFFEKIVIYIFIIVESEEPNYDDQLMGGASK